MKRNLLILAFAFITGISGAQEQSLTIEASQLITTFSFIDSDDNKQNVDYEGIMNSSYGLGYRYIFTNNIILRGGIGKRNGGANYVYDEMNYSWRLEYLDATLGAGYKYDLGRFSPYLVASGYYGYLVRGIQVLNNEEYNITESGILNKSDIGLMVNPGVNFRVSDFVSAYVEGEYLLGLNNIETDPSQKATNQAYAITLGLSFTIK